MIALKLKRRKPPLRNGCSLPLSSSSSAPGYFAAGRFLFSPQREELEEVILTKANFEKEVGQDRAAFVEFYAPWCGHYKKLAPEYEKLGSSFKKAKFVLIGKVDCDEHKSICSKYGLSGYPTIQWFPKGSLEPKKYGVSGYPTLKFFPKENKAGEDYEAERELDDFVKFINQKCGTSRDANGQLTFQAGIVASLDALVKEFVSASNEEQKAILSRMEEEVAKLTGSSAR
ncbi:hypothetical protein ZIOFF_043592 [Zingiber officinale]|uniref:Thioredoxin domain-containing protein n=1 Tax=Zingiber officinale TaxID=94328 RepID=A0A8J5FVK9_ZINOF|nr:hypothetical protein ZIOFF_043592 [Zingiber officinale]